MRSWLYGVRHRAQVLSSKLKAQSKGKRRIGRWGKGKEAEKRGIGEIGRCQIERFGT